MNSVLPQLTLLRWSTYQIGFLYIFLSIGDKDEIKEKTLHFLLIRPLPSLMILRIKLIERFATQKLCGGP